MPMTASLTKMKSSPARVGLDVGLDFIVVEIGIEKNLFAADAAVTQHYPEPVLRQFSSQRHAKPQQNPMIPNRWIVGGESAIRDRNAAISPGYRRLDLHMIPCATAFEKNARRLAKVRRVELDRSRLRVCLGVCRAPCEARSVAALVADQSGPILDIVKQVADQREPETHEQERKERRRPPALQAVMKPYVGPTAAQPVNAVIRQTRWRGSSFPPDRAHAFRNARGDSHSPYNE